MRRAVALGLAATGVVLAAGGYALGPGAAGLVDALADGQPVWRLGALEVEGVRGAWIGDLTAARVTLSDEAGVWLEARDARLRWSPGALLTGRVRIDEATISDAVMWRRPALSAPPRSRGMDFSVSAPALSVESLRLTEEAAGMEARLVVAAAVETRAGSLQGLRAEVLRADAPTDRAAVLFTPGADRPWTVDGAGAPEGLMARLLGAEEAVSLTGQATAEGSQGEGSVLLRIGDAMALEAEGRWASGLWEASGAFDPASAPLLPLADRLGGAGRFEAQGTEEGVFEGRLEAPALTLTLRGAWDGPMQVSAETSQPGVLLGSEAPIADRVAAEGVFERNDRGGRFAGTGQMSGVDIGGFVGDVGGPVTVDFNRERIAVTVDAAVEGAVERFQVTAARGSFVYGRQTEDLTIEEVTVQGPSLRVEARGTPERLSGTVRLEDLSVIATQVAGGLGARFEATREGEAWLVEAAGEGVRVRADDPYGDLLGPRPVFALRGLVTGVGFVVERATLAGSRLRFGARGQVGAEAVDLVWEASGRGPIAVAGVGLSGAVDASGRVLGRPEALRISGAGHLETLDLGALALTPAQVRFAYADGVGTVSLTGLYGDQAFAATGDVIVRDGSILVDGLTADLAGLSAQGALAVEDGALSGGFDLEGPLAALTGGGGTIAARLTLSGTGERPVVDARGEVAAALAGRVLVRQASFTAIGPLESLSIGARAHGVASGTTFDLGATGAASVRGGTISGSISLQGTAGGLPVRSVEPVTFLQRGNDRQIAGSLAIGEGFADFQWTEEGEAFAASADVRSLSIAPVSGLFGEPAEGSLNGRAEVRSVGGRLEGQADLLATDFRVRGRMRSPVDLSVTGRLVDETATALLTAQSEDGLEARVDLSAAVTTQASPVRIAQAPGQTGRANWDVRGPADAVWALAGTADQSVFGDLTGTGEARFGPGSLSGSGTLSLRRGVFEDRLSGVRLQDVSLDVRLSEEAVTVEALSATDGDGGRLSGSGVLDAARAGSLQLALDNLRLVDREDVTGRADGELAFRWDQAGSVLSGDLRLTEATIRGAPTGNADIPTLEVIEINRPDGAVVADEERTRPRGPPTRLALQVRAPQRVFTRYRGVDTEWSLNVSVTGTTVAPELVGEARLLRGEAQLAGRPLAFSRGLVRFRGAPEEAELDIVAEQQTPDLTARVVLSGTVGEPEVSLENDQGLPEDEVLPLLLFGATQAELSPLQAAQLASSLSALTGGSAFDLVDLTRRIAGLDRFDVRQEDEGILVAGGRYLTRQVYVELARTGRGEAQTRVEWLVTPGLTLITSFAQNGEQRVSLRWREEDEETR